MDKLDIYVNMCTEGVVAHLTVDDCWCCVGLPSRGTSMICCGTTVHRHCLRRWFRTQYSSRSCPFCGNLLGSDLEDEDERLTLAPLSRPRARHHLRWAPLGRAAPNQLDLPNRDNATLSGQENQPPPDNRTANHQAAPAANQPGLVVRQRPSATPTHPPAEQARLSPPARRPAAFQIYVEGELQLPHRDPTRRPAMLPQRRRNTSVPAIPHVLSQLASYVAMTMIYHLTPKGYRLAFFLENLALVAFFGRADEAARTDDLRQIMAGAVRTSLGTAVIWSAVPEGLRTEVVMLWYLYALFGWWCYF